MSDPALPSDPERAAATLPARAIEPEPPEVVGLNQAAIAFAHARRMWLAEGDESRRAAARDAVDYAMRSLQEAAIRFTLPGADPVLMAERFRADLGDFERIAQEHAPNMITVTGPTTRIDGVITVQNGERIAAVKINHDDTLDTATKAVAVAAHNVTNRSRRRRRK